ncbi:hypothetical protein A2U01_0094682, partial [Trifolium medium]|nr:hypothetical protein [Trifolium medium]
MLAEEKNHVHRSKRAFGVRRRATKHTLCRRSKSEIKR